MRAGVSAAPPPAVAGLHSDARRARASEGSVDGKVRRAFFGLAAADRRQGLAAERLALAARLAEAARRRARAGEVGALDVRLAELETARAEQERTAADTERARAAARLAVAIG